MLSSIPFCAFVLLLMSTLAVADQTLGNTSLVLDNAPTCQQTCNYNEPPCSEGCTCVCNINLDCACTNHPDPPPEFIIIVQVLLQSYDGCSGTWQALAGDLFVDSPLAKHVQLDRHFDAAAKGTQACCNPAAYRKDPSINCSNTIDECVADRLQLCYDIGDIPSHWFPFAQCVNGPCDGENGCTDQRNIGKPNGLQYECAKKFGTNPEFLKNCTFEPGADAYGERKMQREAYFSDSLPEGEAYGSAGRPAVWIDNVLFAPGKGKCNVSKEYFEALKAEICRMWIAENPTRNPPADCEK